MPSGNNPILSREQIITAIEANRKGLEDSLCSVLEELLASYEEKQKRTGKGVLANIYISLLRTAIPFKKPLYRIDFYDEQKQLDLIEHSAKWNISFLSDIIYTDMYYDPNVIMRYSNKQNYANEQNWFQNALALHQTLIEFMYGICTDVFEGIDMEASNRVSVYIGEFCEESRFLIHLK